MVKMNLQELDGFIANYRESLINRIVGWAIDQGMSLMEFAGAVGIHRSSLARWLNPDSQVKIPPNRMERVSALIGIPTSVLLAAQDLYFASKELNHGHTNNS